FASSDGAPRSSQVLKSLIEWARVHSSKMILAIAEIAPAGAESVQLNGQLSSHASKASGGGSSFTARSSSSRLIAKPIVSGVWSRLRLRLRPSEASRAANKALQTSAGRIMEGLTLATGISCRSESAYLQCQRRGSNRVPPAVGILVPVRLHPNQ